jgi:hypothetical protein
MEITAIYYSYKESTLRKWKFANVNSQYVRNFCSQSSTVVISL